MRVAGTASALVVMTLMGVRAAEAKGCIKGAIIGGVAGHYLADRGIVGAVAGCLTGRYIASRNAKRRDVDYGARVVPGGRYAPDRAPSRRDYAY
ncbi:hypothetical protein [Methylobacterium isbiliense]|jgi:outer membrane lipoprotein SlyB|uniref:Glycine zipper 2TM domain-containing protein n=1 Tax=Methylobacterium isbiliense TaxID=315478 RepID=A0ABQ4SJG6_9HYPH|nr:hypothetical protein [Methylobacterium isbiliense]MDN3625813.1 hypothetical protein [Methylobacterium isbiliense]GJE02563.1 hypothetical protein GMJLKIPL_4512 [Methylobacterium isbiliense]